MYKVVMLPIAKRDIQEAALWYNSRQKGLGKRFTGHVRQKIKLLKQSPFIYSVRYDNIRTAVLEVFPFMIHLSVDEQKRHVIISAVLHTSRNPDLWTAERENS